MVGGRRPSRVDITRLYPLPVPATALSAWLASHAPHSTLPEPLPTGEAVNPLYLSLFERLPPIVTRKSDKINKLNWIARPFAGEAVNPRYLSLFERLLGYGKRYVPETDSSVDMDGEKELTADGMKVPAVTIAAPK